MKELIPMFISFPIAIIILFAIGFFYHKGKKDLYIIEPQEEKRCTDCKYFVGCECFSGMTCDQFTETDKNQREWISVSERLPNTSGKYIVHSKSGLIYQTKFYTYPENKGGHWGQKDKGKNITHWMALPEFPRGGEINDNQ